MRVVARLWLRYTRTDRMRFASHRDVARTLERALVRAQVPIAYSEGFSPHPKISYAGAAPTGTASKAEYLELGLAEPSTPGVIRDALNAALPDGLRVADAVVAPTGPLADRIDASRWEIRVEGCDPERVHAAVGAFLDARSAPVERRMKDGVRVLDARSPVVSLAERGGPGDNCVILDLVVRHVTPAVRPDDVLAALRGLADLVPPSPPVATRLAQGQLTSEGRLADPFRTDAVAAADQV